MTAPLFLLTPDRLADVQPGGDLRLDGDEGRHAATVRRLRAGERVDVADGAGSVARCEVSTAARDHLVLLVHDVKRLARPPLRLVLVQALAKGGRDEQAVETATEIGADAVVPWQAARSVVRWEGERGERSRRRWAATAREAAKQSRRPFVPDVEPMLTTGAMSRRIGTSSLALVLHEAAGRPLVDVDIPAAGEVVVIVGPEGGITDEELAHLAAAGAVPVRLGPEVLRASTAGPVALAVLAARAGRWG